MSLGPLLAPTKLFKGKLMPNDKPCPSCGAENAYGCCDHCNALDEERDRAEALREIDEETLLYVDIDSRLTEAQWKQRNYGIG